MNARADPSGAVARVIDRLRNVRSSGGGWTAQCPGHDDRQNSLSIGEGDDGRVLLTCHAGCSTEAIVKALGLSLVALFENKGGGGADHPRESRSSRQAHRKKPRKPKGTGLDDGVTPDDEAPSPGCTLKQYAAAKKLPEEFLRTLGLTDMVYLKAPTLRIPYLDHHGELVAIRFRIGLSGDKFRWRRRDKPCLYGANRLSAEAPYVAIVEGESDCHTLWRHGISALGLPGAASWKEERDAWLLDGTTTIYVVIEPDRGGDAVTAWIAKSRIRDRVRLVDLGEYKDPSGLHLAHPDTFLEHWQAALERAEVWTDRQAEEAEAARREAWESCKHLARAPEILTLAARELTRCRVVGETHTVKLLYLVVVSRRLARPISVAVKGPSSGGKSFVVENTLKLFPETAYYAITAMSERALAYSEEPLKHRFLVVYEAAGLQGDFASYLVRSLLSEGRLKYETVEKTSEGLVARVIEREGPTGLIVTTTALNLHPENETRMLSLTVTDTADQTRAILEALAEDDEDEIDFAPWHALQQWLEGGEHRVAIPYGPELAKAIPPAALRLRRDFMAVLNLIRAHALLHQGTRARDEDGRVVATLADYAAVHDLVADLVAEGVEATVPPKIRETVNAVQTLIEQGQDEVQQVAICKLLNLDQGAVSRRVRGALRRGYLKNLEERKGRPARLAIDQAMPEDLEILPSPTVLEERLTACPANGGDNTLPSPQNDDIDIEREAIMEFDGHENEAHP